MVTYITLYIIHVIFKFDLPSYLIDILLIVRM